MAKSRVKWVVLVTALVLVVVASVLWVRLRAEPEKALLKVMSDRVDLQVHNVRYTEVGEDGMNWEFTAAAARYQKKENLVFFETFQVRLVMKDGSPYVLSGDRGRLNTASRDLEIEGNVGLLSPLGDRMTTDRLRYWNADRRIETDRPVVLEGRGVTVRGVGLSYLLADKKLSIPSQVRAEVRGGVTGSRQ